MKTILSHPHYVIIECVVSGKYCPGTYEDPPEYPELNIYDIKFNHKKSISIYNFIPQNLFEELEEKAYDNLE